MRQSSSDVLPLTSVAVHQHKHASQLVMPLRQMLQLSSVCLWVEQLLMRLLRQRQRAVLKNLAAFARLLHSPAEPRNGEERSVNICRC